MAGFMKLQVWGDKDSGGYMARYSAPGYLDCTMACLSHSL